MGEMVIVTDDLLRSDLAAWVWGAGKEDDFM